MEMLTLCCVGICVAVTGYIIVPIFFVVCVWSFNVLWRFYVSYSCVCVVCIAGCVSYLCLCVVV